MVALCSKRTPRIDHKIPHTSVSHVIRFIIDRDEPSTRQADIKQYAGSRVVDYHHRYA